MKNLTPKTLIWAHRGASGYAPENTLEAFALAAKMGADGVELDVRLTKDGVVVIAHDDKLERISNAQGLISDYTYEELLAFDFGWGFYKERRGVKIATLREVYELLRPTDLLINIEIKGSDETVSAKALEIVKEFDMLERTVFSAFDHFNLLRVRELEPTAIVGPLYSVGLVCPWEYCGILQANTVHPSTTQVRMYKNYVEKCHENNLVVNVWTTNKEEEMAEFIGLGCDGIITNYPDIAIKIRDGRK